MIKKIKFNLMLGDKYCKNIEEVKNNFNIHDILYYFDKGILEKWLDIQNLNDILEKVSNIDKNDNALKKIDSLIDIFYEDDINKENIKEMHKEVAYIIGLENKRKDDLEILSQNDFKEKEVINNYFKNYEDITKLIIEKKEDYELIKSLVKNIEDNFINIFAYDFYNFYKGVKEAECIFGILSIFANEKTREYFLNDKNIMDSIKDEVMIKIGINEFHPLSSIVSCDYLKKSHPSSRYNLSKNFCYIESKIKTYTGYTDTFSLLVENKKCLIIYLSTQCYITSSVNRDKVYTADDINDKFLILDGIIIKNDEIGEYTGVVYMEI